MAPKTVCAKYVFAARNGKAPTHTPEAEPEQQSPSALRHKGPGGMRGGESGATGRARRATILGPGPAGSRTKFQAGL